MGAARSGTDGGLRLAFGLEQRLAPVPGGTGRYTAELAAALAATAPPGAVVSGWVAWHRSISGAAVAGVAGPRRLPLPRRPLALGWEHGIGPVPRPADVVHAPTLLAPPRRGTPLVVTVHDAVPWTHPGTLTRRGARFHRRMARRVAREADLIVVPTAAVAAELADHLPLRPERVVVVGHGVPAYLDPPPVAAGGRDGAAGAPGERGYLLTLATFEPRKGLDVLLDALAGPGGPALPVVVAGTPGWGGVDPAAEARRRGLPADRVRVVARPDDTRLAALLAGAAALVVPSRQEGFGLPVLEGMAAGVPVVCSDLPALREVGGEAVLTVPAGDPAALAAALSRLATGPRLAAELVAAGRRRAAGFRWRDAAARLWRHYGDLVRGVG